MPPGCVPFKTPGCFSGKRTSGARKGPQVRVDVVMVGAQCSSIAPSVIALHTREGARAIVHLALVVHDSLCIHGGIGKTHVAGQQTCVPQLVPHAGPLRRKSGVARVALERHCSAAYLGLQKDLDEDSVCAGGAGGESNFEDGAAAESPNSELRRIPCLTVAAASKLRVYKCSPARAAAAKRLCHRVRRVAKTSS